MLHAAGHMEGDLNVRVIIVTGVFYLQIEIKRFAGNGSGYSCTFIGDCMRRGLGGSAIYNANYK